MAIGFFTKGIVFELPHPPIPERTILLICKVIQRAWHLLGENPPNDFFLQSEDEDTITLELVEIIEDRLRKSGEVEGFDHALFGRVSREPKISNVDKKHPDKMPDIFFDLRRSQYPLLSDQDGLFVECKPIDKKHSLSSCYCGKGLIRFVNGDYAWAMQDALMVGYVENHFSYKSLATILNDSKKNADLNTTYHSLIDEYAIYRSRHNRTFSWPENRGPACQISVAHLWLSL